MHCPSTDLYRSCLAPSRSATVIFDHEFESAADAFGRHLVGVLLTGANQDGAEGLKRIQEAGGLALIQDPATAQVRSMPEAACALLSPSIEQILSLDEIAHFLLRLRGV